MRMLYNLARGHSVDYLAEFPVAEQGHTCTLHGRAPWERTLLFSTPRLEFYGTNHFLRMDSSPIPVYDYPGATDETESAE
ncbi:hypothetical protein C5B96_04040 [Subtercola sp. Z020]|nr:hypothetical protein C5B96_04040 [Subtercola sp. Z020]